MPTGPAGDGMPSHISTRAQRSETMKRMKISLAVAFAVVGATAAIANATAAGTSNPNVLNGVYRIAWTQKQLIAAGASASYAKNNSSVITMTMRGGQFVQRWSEPPGCAGTYA